MRKKTEINAFHGIDGGNPNWQELTVHPGTEDKQKKKTK